MSGGVDSSVVATLAVRILGRDRVLGLFLPERDSSPDSLRLAQLVADQLAIETMTYDIAPALEALGCYRVRNAAVKRAVAEFTPDSKFSIVLPGNRLDSTMMNFFSVVVELPDGQQIKKRLRLQEYLEIVAATNFKQRTRKMIEYFHADRLNYAVLGTPNRLEYDLGFFVKGGDGAADVKPIAHLYKTQVYKLAEYLGVPEEVRSRPPTTDTYSLEQSQEDFYFALPYHLMDLFLYAKDHDISAEEVGAALGYTTEQAQRVYRDIEQKRSYSAYLRREPVLLT
jgi:NAD+ synthase